MKVIVSFSGGKDSLASLLWVRNNLTKDFITVFCDTGWEHPLTYKYIEEVQEQLGLNLITVKSKKFNGMVDLTKKKSRWPSSQRRFCTSELKTIPMIDYILDEVNDDVLIIQSSASNSSAPNKRLPRAGRQISFNVSVSNSPLAYAQFSFIFVIIQKYFCKIQNFCFLPLHLPDNK